MAKTPKTPAQALKQSMDVETVEGQDETVDRNAEGVDAPEAKATGKKNPNMKRTGRPAHGPEAVAQIELQRQALEYRKMGMSYAQVGQKLGISAQAAWQNVDSALKRVIQEPAKDVIKIELERLDAMFMAVYGNAARGDLMALSGALNIMARRTRYLGLDAAVKTESKTEFSSAEGVMVIAPVMSPDEWMAAAKAQQTAITTDNAAAAANG